MGFAGNLGTLSLEEVFQTINRSHATGVLRLASTETEREMVFADGDIIGVGYRRGEERQRLLRRLVLLGQLDASHAPGAAADQDSLTVLEVLIGQGLIGADVVQKAMGKLAEDELCSLCTWTYADFVFHDAGPEDPEATQLVERYRQHSVKLACGKMLLEMARRKEEWETLKPQLPHDDAVLGIATGREEAELARVSKSYPASAVVPLVDGVRAVEDILRDSVVTRLDVFGILVYLLHHGLICALTREDLLIHAQYRFGKRDFLRAALCCRRALAEQPGDQATAKNLAACLEQVGDQPEVAACHSQLALYHLGAHQGDQAMSCALRAMALAPQDPHQRLILVRCLLEKGEKDEAVSELHAVVTRYFELGQLLDARATCLKILELDPQNQDARRVVARIYAQAEKDPDSEDLVVCLQCGHINHREATTCAACKAQLHLTCQHCQRIVAVSDRLCIFCGADPHPAGPRQAAGSPGTTRIIDPTRSHKGPADKTTDYWKGHLKGDVQQARAFEHAGDFTQALRAWRDIAKNQTDNPELVQYIRDLETKAQDIFIEQTIERGHQMRRIRRFGAAIRAYRDALRTMASDDPRSARLTELLATTIRNFQRIWAIYGTAILILLIAGWLAATPYVNLYRFRRELAATQQQIQGLEKLGPAAIKSMARIRDELNLLKAAVSRLGRSPSSQRANMEFEEIHAQFQLFRIGFTKQALVQITKFLDAGELDEAKDQIDALRRALGTDADLAITHLRDVDERLKALRLQNEQIDRRRQEAPAKLASTQELEKAGEFGQALAAYRVLAGLGQASVSSAAQEGIARLEPKERAFQAVWKQVAELAAVDWVKADAVLTPLADQARVWGLAEEYANRNRFLAQSLAEADAASQKLGPQASAAALEAFLAKYSPAPQVGPVRVRLDQLHKFQRARDDLLATYRGHVAAKRYDQAWLTARQLITGGGPLPDDLLIPLVVESVPSGAEVRVGDEVRGRTPCVLAFPPGASQEVTVSAPGWQPAKRGSREVTAEWRWQVVLVKQLRWRLELGKPVSMIQPQPDGGLLVMAGENLQQVDAQGRVGWSSSLATGDDLDDASRLRLAHAPVTAPDGRQFVGLPSKDVLVLDRLGAVSGRLVTTSQVRGRPVFYLNDILGGHQRLAYAAEALYCGDLDSEPTRLALPGVALAGPLVLARDLDRMLVVATIQGHLLAFEESTRKRLWDVDLKAAETGQLLPVGNDRALVVLDGSRLVCYQLSATGATVRWNQSFNTPAVGDPVVGGGTIYLAVGQVVVRYNLEGVALQPLALPAPAVTSAEVAGDTVAVGCRNGALVVFRQGAPAWSSTCEAIPGAVACGTDMVVVGLANGSLCVYPP
jgi:outer membrane protein assembly factor BamB